MPTISGTQSPPLEATGSHIPMGASSVEQAMNTKGPCQCAYVSDREQRSQYFEDTPRSGTPVTGAEKEKSTTK
ncbi:hypothetical protein JAAARDRAFT_193207 [Jaapia argillacea MUCL 33604]|uniref:Uncharacterized protein n=1 Tax=Jaapia argillacea MUCL 33604 TaxID=933084 RepID=A0A067PVC5_9AGAM|nr:hypothetical protein JAAARDRAFT_193207 [Jaapia argillacea MUCL 33604]